MMDDPYVNSILDLRQGIHMKAPFTKNFPNHRLRRLYHETPGMPCVTAPIDVPS